MISTHTNTHSNACSDTHSDTHSNTHSSQQADKIPNNLLSHPQLWRAGQLKQLNQRNVSAVNRAVSSGYTALDAQLPGGGWPRAGLAEVLHAQPGLGELRLLAPALADLSEAEDRWIAWINPPAIPYAPALGRFGIRTDRLLMIHPKSHQDALWAAEQAARSGTCSAVLIWLDDNRLKHAETRRLQVAAKQGNSLACLFRPTRAAQHASAAELRLQLHNPSYASNSTSTSTKNAASYSTMQVDILKRRGGWAIDNIGINLVGDDPVRRLQDIQQQLSLWRDLQRQPLQTHLQTRLPTKQAQTSPRRTPARPAASAVTNEQAVVQQLH